jgi:hypothetical protein
VDLQRFCHLQVLFFRANHTDCKMDQASTVSAAFLRSLTRLDDNLSWSSAPQSLKDFLLSHWLSLAALILVTFFVAHGYLVFFHRPLRLIRHFQKQGIQGPPFRPIVGHMPEVMAGIKETAETGEVFPNFVSWRKLYGEKPCFCVQCFPSAFGVQLSCIVAGVKNTAVCSNVVIAKRRELYCATFCQPAVGKFLRGIA